MISAQQNELIIRIGADTLAGLRLRRCWRPPALGEALTQERPIKAVRLLGPDLVFCRDESGALGLLDRDCPHRGDLAFGWLENEALHGLFHGWLFNVQGLCIEALAEPEDSRICGGIRPRSYLVIERSEVIFAHSGDGDPPTFADLDCFISPQGHVFAFKGRLDDNWPQAQHICRLMAEDGGYGDPLDRDPAPVREDALDDMVTRGCCAYTDGAILTGPKAIAVDVPATEALRASLRKRPSGSNGVGAA